MANPNIDPLDRKGRRERRPVCSGGKPMGPTVSASVAQFDLESVAEP
jgi:hypothetical protein